MKWRKQRKEEPEAPRDRLLRLIQLGRHRTALDEILRGLRLDPKNNSLLNLGLVIVSGSRTRHLEAAEPVTHSQMWNALLAPVATECSSCHKAWYSAHSLVSGYTKFHLMNPAGLQCQKCRYTLCRDCFSAKPPLSADDPVDMPERISESCPEPGHGVLGAPVLPTGRSDVEPMDPDRIEAVIVTREGPIPPTMDEALDAVTHFLPLVADDAPLIHIHASRPGLMADESGRDELALTLIRDLESEGKLAPGAWNRSKRTFVKTHNRSDTSYLLTVIRRENKNDPHPCYGLYSGMSKKVLISLIGKPESSVRNCQERQSAGSEHWFYRNTPSGIDTEIVITDGLLEAAEMKSREDGQPVLRVTANGTFTPVVGYAVYALVFLLAQMPLLNDTEIESTIRTVPETDLVTTALSVLRPWAQHPEHGIYALTRRSKGVLVASDVKLRCAFWRLTGDRIAVSLSDGPLEEPAPWDASTGPSAGSQRSYAGFTAAELIDCVAHCRQSGRQQDTVIRGILDELRREYGHPAYPFAASLERLAFGTSGPPLFQESMEPDEVDVINNILQRLTTGAGESPGILR
jgi:hypothetical protein